MSSVTGREYDALPSLDKGAEDGPRRNQASPLLLTPTSEVGGDDFRPAESGHGHVPSFHQTQEPIHGDDFSPALGRTSIGMGVQIGALREHVRPGSNTDHTVIQGASVRRLTPTECERLQALPDGWTAYGPDSRRYAALGDAVTSSVGEWIGRRLMAVPG